MFELTLADLLSILVNFWCEFGQIMTNFMSDFEQFSNQLQLYLIPLLVNFQMNWGQ